MLHRGVFKLSAACGGHFESTSKEVAVSKCVAWIELSFTQLKNFKLVLVDVSNEYFKLSTESDTEDKCRFQSHVGISDVFVTLTEHHLQFELDFYCLLLQINDSNSALLRKKNNKNSAFYVSMQEVWQVLSTSFGSDTSVMYMEIH